MGRDDLNLKQQISNSQLVGCLSSPWC